MEEKNLRKITKILFIFICALCMVLTINIVVVNATLEEKVSVLPEKSEEFEEWEDLSDEEKEESVQPAYSTTDIKSSIKRSTYNTYTQLVKEDSGDTDTIDSYFNLKDSITLNVKNQEKTGSCWAFSFTSVLETVMANKYEISGLEYSPLHIDYVTSNLYNKQLGEGGNAYMALAYSISGYGPVNEEDFPFESVYDEENNSSSSYYLADVDDVDLEQLAQLRVDDAIYYPAIYKSYSDDSVTYKNSNNTTYTEDEVEAIRKLIKEDIMANGGVSTTVAYSSTIGSSVYYNGETYAFYNNSSSATANHGVTIIGWDDEYSASNFNENYQPLNDGAWIVLNTWGSSYGDEGIFYVSYDDTCIERAIVGISDITNFEEDSSEVYDYLYEYDELGMNYMFYAVNDDGTEYLTSAYAANVYTREDVNNDEYINEVGIYLAETEGVEIYINAEDDDLTNLELVASYTGSNALEAGYHTIQLSTPISLTGEKFVVAVKYINSEQVALPIECNLLESGFTAESNIYDTASSNEGESFYSTDGENWEDLYNYNLVDISATYTLVNTNFCVKAFTITQEATTADVAVTGISLDETEITIIEGETATLIATIEPMDATNQNITWTSSDETVATVSGGVVTGIAEGTAIITVTTEDGEYTAQATITVETSNGTDTDVAVTGVSLDEIEITITEGETATLVATVIPTDATNQNVTWTSSDETVASVSESGVITGIAEGTAVITVTSEDGEYTAQATITVETSDIVSVTGISLDEEELELEVDETTNLVATITPTDATNKNVTWTSSDETVATVTSTGVITAVATGTVTITVTTEDGEYTASCTVTVTEKTSSDDNIYTEDGEGEDEEDDDSDSSDNTTNNTTSTSSTNATTNTSSSSKSTTSLPYTGTVSIIFAMISLVVIAVITKYKYSKYKDIK